MQSYKNEIKGIFPMDKLFRKAINILFTITIQKFKILTIIC